MIINAILHTIMYSANTTIKYIYSIASLIQKFNWNLLLIEINLEEVVYMEKRNTIKTTKKEAVDYWSCFVDECDLSVDWSEGETHCWRCGCERKLERCHIIPDSLGGKDEPANIVLLCERCHAEGPNVSDAEIMWDWIKAYKVSFYETFWSIQGMKEYEFIYKRTLMEELEYIFTEANLMKEDKIRAKAIKVALHLTREEISVHFGQPYFNTATMAGVYRMMLKKLAGTYGVTFPRASVE